MAYKQSMAEIIEQAGKQKTKADKIAYLRQHMSRPLKNVLILTYDKSKQFLVPDSKPPYTPSEFPDSQGLMFQESTQRKLKYIVKGFSDPNISQAKREQIFIEILESVDKQDAEMLCMMIQKKPFPGLRFSTINEALDGALV